MILLAIAPLAYLLVGTVLIVAMPNRRSRILSLWDDELAAQSVWKAVLVTVAVIPLALVLWPRFLNHWPRKRKSFEERLKELPNLRKLMRLYEVLDRLSEGGCETDEIPGGRGEFGLEISNPVPTHTILGSGAYLDRLRAPDGSRVVCERQGSRSSDVIKRPIDCYTVSHPDGRKLAVIYLSPYHKRNSEKAPSGFTLAGPPTC